ncbi:hypothetical protein [Stenotrophomonas sp. 24(2023)]|uniref:hypothetical protein n=1 Tax=Stenotrophomonas sp. 24(2023) TaxID=3068324 RepID=UPI0027DF5933|nr:hypothetical protein [Stenotrophomonas sp. 24(2023)]WMJ70174.1 hypothetical protein Q9R17_03450 [Stenotrophomonas sp. 24(2023)]
MHRKPGQSLQLGIACDGLSLLCSPEWADGQPGLLAQVSLPSAEGHSAATVPTAAALAEAVDALLAPLAPAHRHWPLHVVLDDRLARLWQVTPPATLSLWSGVADLRSMAAMRLQQLHGENPADWQITAGWQARHPFMAAALPHAVLAALRALAERHGLWLASVRPHLLAVWDGSRRQRRSGLWLGLVHDGRLGLALAHGQRLHQVRWQGLPAQADTGWLARVLAREALMQSLPVPDDLLLSGPAPHWLQQDPACRPLVPAFPDASPPSLPASLWLAAAGAPP